MVLHNLTQPSVGICKARSRSKSFQDFVVTESFEVVSEINRKEANLEKTRSYRGDVSMADLLDEEASLRTYKPKRKCTPRPKKLIVSKPRSGTFCYVQNIPELLRTKALLSYDANDFFLGIDSSIESTKFVLVDTKNRLPPLPICYGRSKADSAVKESYDMIEKALQAIQYDVHRWPITGDFKIISLITGHQGGSSTFGCWRCLWNNKQENQYEVSRERKKRTRVMKISAFSINHVLF